MSGPIPVIIAGPSGVGKGTIINRLLNDFPHLFGFSVSHTTRSPREGEVNGVHYHFVEKSVFDQAIEENAFVEFAHVHVNSYGTSFKAIEDVTATNKVCILDIDIQGVESVKRSGMKTNSLFVLPPSMEELEKRLRGRGTETDDKIKKRMENAVGEINYSTIEGNFDISIINAEFEETYQEIVNHMKTWYSDLAW